jgi:hypothetical protein
LETSVDSGDVRALAWNRGGTTNILIISKTDEAKLISLQGITEQWQCSWIDDSIPYTDARLQTQVVNSGELIQLNGYTVMLLQQST